MTPEQLAEIQKRADAATPGPWHRVGPPWNRYLPFVIAGDTDPHVGRFVCDLDSDPADEPDEPGNEVADAEFIAHAREDVPALVAEVKRLTAERDADRAEIVQLCQERLQLVAERDAARAEMEKLADPPGDLPNDRDGMAVAWFDLYLRWKYQQERAGRAETERDEARAGWTKAVEIATEASNQRDQALAALETAVDALRSGT